jgi:hypothetical protein
MEKNLVLISSKWLGDMYRDLQPDDDRFVYYVLIDAAAKNTKVLYRKINLLEN